jgi:hypothetical protein
LNERQIRKAIRRDRSLNKETASRQAREEQRLHDLRPTSRSQCVDAPRPCHIVSCKHHLYLDVDPESGDIHLNFPGKEIWELKETCSLDVADRGAQKLKDVGVLTGLKKSAAELFVLMSRLRLMAAEQGTPRGRHCDVCASRAVGWLKLCYVHGVAFARSDHGKGALGGLLPLEDAQRRWVDHEVAHGKEDPGD